MNWSGTLRTPTNRLPKSNPKVYHMPAWGGYGDRDPKIATLAVKILKKARVKPRQFKKQAAALLKWVQDNIYYVNEPGERLQDPLYTLKVGYGDCDDMLPVKLVICGVNKSGQKVRYHQGDQHYPPDVDWSHIYLAIGNDPFNPTFFYYAEPTVPKAPLGWDVINAKKFNLPELAGYGSAAAAIAGSMAEMTAMESGKRGAKHMADGGLFGLNWKSIFAAALVGALVSVSTDGIKKGIKYAVDKQKKRAKKSPPVGTHLVADLD
jgi:hypothetical protein